MKKRLLISAFFCTLWFSSFSQKGGGGGGNASVGGAAGGASVAAQIQPGYHYFLNNIKIDWHLPFIHVWPKRFWYITTMKFKVPGKYCHVPKNISSVLFIFNPDSNKWQYDTGGTKAIYYIKRKNKEDSAVIISTNVGKKVDDSVKYVAKDTIFANVEKNDSTKLWYKEIRNYTIYKKKTPIIHADTCSSYIRYYAAEDDSGNYIVENPPDTLISVSSADTGYRYFSKTFNLKGIGISQDSGKILLMLNGKRKLIRSPPSISKTLYEYYDSIQKNKPSNFITFAYHSNIYNLITDSINKSLLTTPERRFLQNKKDNTFDPIDLEIIIKSIANGKYSDNEKRFLDSNIFPTFKLVAVDSSKYDSCRYCGHKHQSDTMQIGVDLYTKKWTYPLRVDSTDSVNNFCLLIKKRSIVKNLIYFYRVPFARWEAGAVNIPLQFTPGHNDVALNGISTTFLNVNAFLGRAWGNTKFYYDPSKTHTAFTGMLSVFAGVGQLPALTIQSNGAGKPPNNSYNLSPQAASLAGTSQLGFSYGAGATVTIDIFDLGLFVGNTLGIGSGELVNGWYGENKWWVGFGLGLNIGMFNNALTNAWE